MRAVTGMDISADGQHLYVGTQGGGVFRLDLNGQPPLPMIQPTIPATDPPAAATAESPTPAPSEADRTGVVLYIGVGVGVVVLAVVAFVLARRRHG
jgi:hypothetical protein